MANEYRVVSEPLRFADIYHAHGESNVGGDDLVVLAYNAAGILCAIPAVESEVVVAEEPTNPDAFNL